MRDFVVLAVASALMLAVAFRAGRRTRSLRDFFLAGRRMPWIVTGLSLVATEVSVMTIIGVPAAAFREDWSYLQFFFGAAVARVLVSTLFVPVFYRHDCTTIYEYLGKRFGRWTRSMAAIFFIGTRLLSSGGRLAVACVAAGALLGVSFQSMLGFFIVIGTLCALRGGIESVIWANTVQFVCFFGGGVLSAAFLLRRVDGGLPAALHLAAEAGKLRLLDAAPTLFEPGFFWKLFFAPNFLWTALLGGFVGSAAAFGADQEVAQKLLVAESAGASRKAMILSIVASLATFLVYMAIGTLLFVFYKQNPGLALSDRLDRIYPHFAATAMPRVLRALVLTAIVMATIDLPLVSLASVLMTDCRPSPGEAVSEEKELRRARASVVFFAVLLAETAWLFGSSSGTMWIAFKIGAVTYGPLLAVFLLGLTASRGTDVQAAVAMVVMAALCAAFLLAAEMEGGTFVWGWLTILGFAGTYGLVWMSDRRRTGGA